MKALIAMSGGVDSTVAAHLMKERGFDCAGATMKLFPGDDASVRDAREAAGKLGIPHYVFDFSDEFERLVIREFIEAYEAGLTPNPCVLCNKSIKFGALLAKAAELECGCLVTGHYAIIKPDEKTGRFSLKKAFDGSKDQSYFLCLLTQEQLARAVFPLGGMTKKEARAIAEAQGFPCAQKRESQDICFIDGCNGNYSDFIERCAGRAQPRGDFIDREGRTLGRHKGLIRYTIGQRKGLGIAAEHPLYVCAKDAVNNTVTLGGEETLYSASVCAASVNWIRGKPPAPFRAAAKVRYRQTEQWGTVTEAGDNFVRVEFDEPRRAITPGQALALYDGDEVIGGGTIVSPTPLSWESFFSSSPYPELDRSDNSLLH